MPLSCRSLRRALAISCANHVPLFFCSIQDDLPARVPHRPRRAAWVHLRGARLSFAARSGGGCPYQASALLPKWNVPDLHVPSGKRHRLVPHRMARALSRGKGRGLDSALRRARGDTSRSTRARGRGALTFSRPSAAFKSASVTTRACSQTTNVREAPPARFLLNHYHAPVQKRVLICAN